jgi:hypothetical protein
MSEIKKPKGYRTLNIGLETWYWTRGKKSTVIISPLGKRSHVSNDVIADILETTCECCGESDGGEIPVVLPSGVRKYIDANLRT